MMKRQRFFSPVAATYVRSLLSFLSPPFCTCYTANREDRRHHSSQYVHALFAIRSYLRTFGPFATCLYTVVQYNSQLCHSTCVWTYSSLRTPCLRSCLLSSVCRLTYVSEWTVALHSHCNCTVLRKANATPGPVAPHGASSSTRSTPPGGICTLLRTYSTVYARTMFGRGKIYVERRRLSDNGRNRSASLGIFHLLRDAKNLSLHEK